MNKNGQRLVDICSLNNLVKGGTLFPHLLTHKLTWNSPNGRDKNQIDHKLVNGKWNRSLIDVKVGRSADVNSDHHLGIALLKVKLRSIGITLAGIKRFNTDKLKDRKVRNTFVTQFRNRFDVLTTKTPDNNDVNNIWDDIKNAYEEASKHCLGFKTKNTVKKWLTPTTWDAIEKRRHIKLKELDAKSQRLKEKHKEDYRIADKEDKKLTRKDKIAYIEDIAKRQKKLLKRGNKANSIS
uniref:Uncharacterized protein LOC111116262 n=1 Tax=Crassostrea virginica TaxID=6565 RepID=A0A8B8C822_CRAVI|nr:uncharacterized protein LOC111116262 [Crassostrea virginica]